MSAHPDPERLAAVAAGEPTDAGLAAHLAGCAPCRTERDGLRELGGRLWGLEPVEWVEPPATLRAVVLAAAGGSGLASPRCRSPMPAPTWRSG